MDIWHMCKEFLSITNVIIDVEEENVKQFVITVVLFCVSFVSFVCNLFTGLRYLLHLLYREDLSSGAKHAHSLSFICAFHE